MPGLCLSRNSRDKVGWYKFQWMDVTLFKGTFGVVAVDENSMNIVEQVNYAV